MKISNTTCYILLYQKLTWKVFKWTIPPMRTHMCVHRPYFKHTRWLFRGRLLSRFRRCSVDTSVQYRTFLLSTFWHEEYVNISTLKRIKLQYNPTFIHFTRKPLFISVYNDAPAYLDAAFLSLFSMAACIHMYLGTWRRHFSPKSKYYIKVFKLISHILNLSNTAILAVISKTKFVHFSKSVHYNECTIPFIDIFVSLLQN